MVILRKSVLLAILALAGRQLLPADNSIVVVVNATMPVTAVAQDDLREIFLGTRHSLPDGSRLTPVLLQEGPAHDSFLRSYVSKSAAAFRTWWLQYVFTGQGVLPRAFESEAALVEYVSRTRGAIGYATRASVRGNVKCLEVIPAHGGSGGLP